MSCDSNESGASSARAQRCSSRLSLRQLCSSSVSFASYAPLLLLLRRPRVLPLLRILRAPGGLGHPLPSPLGCSLPAPPVAGARHRGPSGRELRARARARVQGGLWNSPCTSSLCLFPYPWLRKGPSGAPTGIRLLVSCRFLWVPLSEDLPPEQASARSLLPVPLLPLLLLFLLLLLLPPTSLTSAPALQSCPPAGGSSFQAVDWHPSAE